MNDATAHWLQLSLEASAYSTEQLEDALWQAGAIAVTLQDAGDHPVLEPLPGETPLWPRTRVTGLFAAQTDTETVQQTVRRALGQCSPTDYRLARLAERDWVRAWLDHFQPLRFGRLWVCPKHLTPPDPAAVNLRLDPGLAFGTGNHPTTALCLTWLDAADLDGKTVIDYGCGSGILAIAAAKLGARQVWAVDIDPQALLASAHNAEENGIADRIHLSSPDELPAIKADILLANILAAPLIELAGHFGELVRHHGQLVLSGILPQQIEALHKAFAPWFDFQTLRHQEDWVLLQALRNP